MWFAKASCHVSPRKKIRKPEAPTQTRVGWTRLSRVNEVDGGCLIKAFAESLWGYRPREDMSYQLHHPSLFPQMSRLRPASTGHSGQWVLQWALMTRWLLVLGQASTPMPWCLPWCPSWFLPSSAASSAGPCLRPSHLSREISGGPMNRIEPVDGRSSAAL